MGKQRTILIAGAVLAILVALHPPWKAHAVTSKMDFRGFPAVAPTMSIDSTTWSLPFAAVYSPPSLDLPAAAFADYQRRLMAGDSSAAGEWRQRTESIETRYRVPGKLKSVWISDGAAGSRSGVAFRRTIVSSRFEVDRLRLAVQLAAVIVATLIVTVFAKARHD